MQKSAFLLTMISLFILLSATFIHATERTTVFRYESIKYKSGTGAKRCQAMCARKSGPDAQSLLSEGWKIVGTSPKEVVAENYWFTPCSACEPHGCNCIGTESVLEREKPAPVVKIPESELNFLKKENELLKKENTSLKQENEPAPKVKSADNELEFFKKENEALRKENSTLKLENENFRNQMKSTQKQDSH
jgi:hypothetical protein